MPGCACVISQEFRDGTAAVARYDESLSQIDLTKIGAVATKGRVQDREYNQLPVVENLIAHGTEAVPLLIGRLDDVTHFHAGSDIEL